MLSKKEKGVAVQRVVFENLFENGSGFSRLALGRSDLRLEFEHLLFLIRLEIAGGVGF